MKFSDLLVILGSFQNIFNFCVSQKLLASSQQCSRCGCNMELTETTRVKDGYMWRCTNKRCRTWLSIRSGSFFEGSNIMSSCWLHLMFLWAIQISGSRIARLTSLSKPTVVRALRELRTICSNNLAFNHRRCCSSVFPTAQERPLFIVSSQHISNLELSSTQINSLRTYHSTSWDISMYQSIIPRTLLTPTVVHTPIPSKVSGPWSRKS